MPVAGGTKPPQQRLVIKVCVGRGVGSINVKLSRIKVRRTVFAPRLDGVEVCNLPGGVGFVYPRTSLHHPGVSPLDKIFEDNKINVTCRRRTIDVILSIKTFWQCAQVTKYNNVCTVTDL